MTIKKLALTATASAFALGLSAANAATLFTANLTTEQNVGDRDPAVDAFEGSAEAMMTLEETEPGVYALSLVVNFSSGFDFTGVIGTEGGIPGDAVSGEPGTEGADVTLFHFHAGDRGEAGGVVFGLFGPNTNEDGDTELIFGDDGSATLLSEWDFDEGAGETTLADFVAELLAATTGDDVGLYLNLHASDPNAPAGLIRGQLVAMNDVGSAIPVPAALPLFGSAIAGAAFLRRRRRAAQ